MGFRKLELPPSVLLLYIFQLHTQGLLQSALPSLFWHSRVTDNVCDTVGCQSLPTPGSKERISRCHLFHVVSCAHSCRDGTIKTWFRRDCVVGVVLGFGMFDSHVVEPWLTHWWLFEESSQIHVLSFGNLKKKKKVLIILRSSTHRDSFARGRLNL